MPNMIPQGIKRTPAGSHRRANLAGVFVDLMTANRDPSNDIAPECGVFQTVTRQHSVEDCREISVNLVGFFRVLGEWARQLDQVHISPDSARTDEAIRTGQRQRAQRSTPE